MKKLMAILTVLICMPLMTPQASAPQSNSHPKYSKPWFGMASWYGDDWAGKKTACGQIFDPERLTAAHPYLPCGTWVRITCVRTGKSEFARITDRGPYEEGREIDVTERIARKIGILHNGVEQVKIEVVREVEK